jgi:hypothetical protein
VSSPLVIDVGRGNAASYARGDALMLQGSGMAPERDGPFVVLAVDDGKLTLRRMRWYERALRWPRNLVARVRLWWWRRAGGR